MGRRVLALLLLLVMLSGCWSRIELNDIGIVLGLAVDVGEEERIRLTLFVPRPLGPKQVGGGAQEPLWVVAREADNFTDAMALIRMASARRLVFHHLRVVLIGEEYARQRGIADLLDILATNQEIRLTLRPFLVEGRAQEVFETMPQLRNMQPTNLIGILQARGMVEWRLKNLLVARAADTHTMWMPALKVVRRLAGTAQSPPTAVIISGAALFRRDYLVRTISTGDNQLLAWFLGNPSGSVISAPCPDAARGSLTARVLAGRARIRPRWQGDRPAFRVELEGHLNLARSQCGLGEAEMADVRQKLEAALGRHLRQRTEAFVALLQESATDPVGFGKHAQLAFPDYFRGLGDRWAEVEWGKVPVEVSARMVISQSGLVTGPVHPTKREMRRQRQRSDQQE